MAAVVVRVAEKEAAERVAGAKVAAETEAAGAGAVRGAGAMEAAGKEEAREAVGTEEEMEVGTGETAVGTLPSTSSHHPQRHLLPS